MDYLDDLSISIYESIFITKALVLISQSFYNSKLIIHLRGHDNYLIKYTLILIGCWTLIFINLRLFYHNLMIL